MRTKTEKIKLKEYFAVLNTKDESVEISKFFKANRNMEYVSKQIESIIVRLYSRLRDQTFENSFDYKKGEYMIGIGETDRVVELDSNKAEKIVKMISYNRYRGHCLNEKKLSYFVPIQTICSGEISMDEI